MSVKFTRREFLAASLVPCVAALVGCASRSQSAQEGAASTTAGSAASNNASASGSTSAATQPAGNGKALVVYFSYTGHLDTMAHWLADETGSDLVRVTAVDAYPDDYDTTVERAKTELDNGTRPQINVNLTPEQLKEYDTVFFGFPVWWYDLPMPMVTFLENNDLSGKTVIPLLSHEGSSNGANALPNLEKLAKGATVRSQDALSIHGKDVDGSESAVRSWATDLGYSK